MTELLDFIEVHHGLINTILIHAMLALSLYVNLAVGQLSMAGAPFMGIGAYTAALMTVRLRAPFVLSLSAGVVMAVLVALLIALPVTRLKGVFLAIATIAFGEVVRVVIINWDFTGGALGLNGIPVQTATWHNLAVLAALLFGFARLSSSRYARLLAAVRIDETAAETSGIPTRFYKTTAFVVSAAIAGLAGGLSAHMFRFIAPGEFTFSTALSILTWAVVGGAGSYIGPVIGAVTLTSLPEVLRFLSQYRLFVNGVLLLAVILVVPEGLLGVPRLARQLIMRIRGGAGVASTDQRVKAFWGRDRR